jgi:hypothetical protein
MDANQAVLRVRAVPAPFLKASRVPIVPSYSHRKGEVPFAPVASAGRRHQTQRLSWYACRTLRKVGGGSARPLNTLKQSNASATTRECASSALHAYAWAWLPNLPLSHLLSVACTYVDRLLSVCLCRTLAALCSL